MKLLKSLAGCLVVAAVSANSLALQPLAGYAVTCQRTVGIDQQESVGEGAGALTFEVYTTGCAAAGTVAYTVTQGTALAGADFRETSGSLQWLTGDAGQRTISVPVVADLERESILEDLTVRLVAPSADVWVAHPAGHGRILDDDWHLPVWVVDDAFCPQDLPLTLWCRCEPVQQSMPIPKGLDCEITELRLTGLTAEGAEARWSTVDGTARAGVDFVGVTDQVQVVAPGATAARLRVRLLMPSEGTQAARWFSIRLSAVTAGTIADGIAVITLPAS